jgi:hypothetical protein
MWPIGVKASASRFQQNTQRTGPEWSRFDQKTSHPLFIGKHAPMRLAKCSSGDEAGAAGTTNAKDRRDRLAAAPGPAGFVLRQSGDPLRRRSPPIRRFMPVC